MLEIILNIDYKAFLLTFLPSGLLILCGEQSAIATTDGNLGIVSY